MSLSMIWIDNQLISIIILALLIFLARVADVTLGTLRIVFISQGRRKLAPIVGFFEIFIWLLAIGQIISDLSNIIYYFAYAGGLRWEIMLVLLLKTKSH